MKKIIAAVLLTLTGCQARSDYLEADSGNRFVKNASRVMTVLSPASFAARVIVNEIVKDTGNTNALTTTARVESPTPNSENSSGDPNYASAVRVAAIVEAEPNKTLIDEAIIDQISEIEAQTNHPEISGIPMPSAVKTSTAEPRTIDS